MIVVNKVILFPKKRNTRSYQTKLHLHLFHNTEHSVPSDYDFKFVFFFSYFDPHALFQIIYIR